MNVYKGNFISSFLFKKRIRSTCDLFVVVRFVSDFNLNVEVKKLSKFCVRETYMYNVNSVEIGMNCNVIRIFGGNS